MPIEALDKIPHISVRGRRTQRLPRGLRVRIGQLDGGEGEGAGGHQTDHEEENASGFVQNGGERHDGIPLSDLLQFSAPGGAGAVPFDPCRGEPVVQIDVNGA